MTRYTLPTKVFLQKVKNSFLKKFLADDASIRYLKEGFIEATDIPFVKHIGLKEKEKQLSLDLKRSVCNHVDTIHAAAQFTLAETESGMHLQSLFPDLEQKVIPLLREAQIKYKKPAKQKIIAYSFAEKEDVEKFIKQFGKKGRALLQIKVEIRDVEDVVTCVAHYTWYVQARIDDENIEK